MILERVEEVDAISKEDFIQQYRKKQIPLLIKAYAKQWQAFDKWNFDYIKAKTKGQEVPIYDNKPADANKSSDAPATYMKMDEYLDEIQTSSSDKRIFFYIITDRLPELLKNFTYPDLGIKFFKRLPTLFFGGNQAHVLMHYDVDMSDFVHIHFEGKKRILLFDQKQSQALYKVPLSVHTIETIDYDNPDYEKYPALKNAKGFEVMMEHGDLLYIPKGWWHYNRYLEPGFSMSLREMPSPARLSNFLDMLYHVFIMRYTDKICRKIGKEKWIKYKQDWAFRRSESRKYKS
ncbi:cupin-like domain-containing protein [Vaginella massiliensis]|uniref:cupin-like domain-containing protein n=1 Tax=Vaginella massiliensis TaxID=1816680 RepID=UPI0037530DD8